MDTNAQVILKLGELSGIVTTSAKHITKLSDKIDTQVDKINELSSSLNLFKAHSATCDGRFKDINDKLDRDFISINNLTKEASANKSVQMYKISTIRKIVYLLAAVGTFVGIVTGTLTIKDYRENGTMYEKADIAKKWQNN